MKLASTISFRSHHFFYPLPSGRPGLSYLFLLTPQVLESADAGDEKAITAIGLLNTMHTILAVMGERPEVHQALKPVILQVRERLHLVRKK